MGKENDMLTRSTEISNASTGFWEKSITNINRGCVY